MGRKLAGSVAGDDGRVYPAGTDESDIPEAAGLDKSADYWEGSKRSTKKATATAASSTTPPANNSPENQPPPRGGEGSGQDEWAAYAAARDVEVAADATRDDIIAACEAAGLVEPPTGD